MISNIQPHDPSTSPQSQESVRSGHATSQQFDPWLIWVTARRCWPWAVPVGAILAGLVAFAVLETFVPVYKADHLLEANTDFVVFKGVMPTVTELAKTEKQLFFNPIVLDPVLSDASLRKSPSLSNPDTAEQMLRSGLSVSSAGSSSRIFVSYTDTDRNAAAAVCNAVVESYLRQRDSFDDTRISNLEKWLEPEIERWQQEVENRRSRVKKLSEQTLGYAPGQSVAMVESDSEGSLLAGLRTQIADLTAQLAILDAQLENRPRRVVGLSNTEFLPPELNLTRVGPTEEQIDQAIDADSTVRESKALVARYKGVILNLEDQDLVRVRREFYEETKLKLDSAEVQLESDESEARIRVTAELNRQADRRYELAQVEASRQMELLRKEFERNKLVEQQKLKAQIEAEASKELKEREDLETRLSVLREQYSEERVRLEQFGGTSATLQFANEELGVANDVLNKLRNRVAAIRTERRQDGAVRSLAPAVPPKSPVESVPTKKILAAAGVAFLFPFLLGVLWEFRVQRVTDSNALEKRSLTAIVGEVARLPSGTKIGSRGRRIFEESVDTLRANLFLSLQTKDTRSIAVASSMSAEGKSSVASQLALSIAKASGQTVLLVDADLRCPDQHDIFGLEMGPGLSGVLEKTASFEDAIDQSLGSLVHVLPAGSLNCSPHRLVNEHSIKGFVDEALKNYSVVIFDTAPVLAAGETLAIASVVDTTLLCVMRDVSRMENVSRTTRRLEAAGANIAGTVFSGVTARQYAYRYGDYHYAFAGDPGRVS